MTFEPWISSFKHRNESWAEFSLHFSAPLQTFPSPISTSSAETQAVLAEQKKAPFVFWRKASKSELSRQDCTCPLIWHILTDLSSLSLVFLPQPSLFVLNFHWDQQKVSYHTLLFASSKLERLKHFPLNVCSDRGKAGSLGNFSKIASAVGRNNTKGRSRDEVI